MSIVAEINQTDVAVEHVAKSLQPEAILTLVNSILSTLSRRYSLQYADQEDLRQAGTIAALQIYEGYDPDEGTIEAFLAPRIRFAMLDEMDTLHAGGITGDYSGDRPTSLETRQPDWFQANSASLDDGSSTPSEPTLRESLEDTGSPDLDREKLADDVVAALSSLPYRSSSILVRYYGLRGVTPHTMRELAGKYRVGVAEIHRRIDRALKELKDIVESTTSSYIAGQNLEQKHEND